MNKKYTLETTRKKMLEFVNMARKKEYSDMDIVDVILSQFIFGYAQEKYKQGQQDRTKEIIKRIEEWFGNQDNIEAVIKNLKKKFLKAQVESSSTEPEEEK